MPEWKAEIKHLAKDFLLSQVKVNRMLKRVEIECMQRPIPLYYNGDVDAYLYDNAQKEMMKMIYA